MTVYEASASSHWLMKTFLPAVEAAVWPHTSTSDFCSTRAATKKRYPNKVNIDLDGVLLPLSVLLVDRSISAIYSF